VKFKVVGIGEVLWDMLPDGKQLGGAAANFVYHARALGCDAALISRVGNDALGHELIAALEKLSMPIDYIEIDSSAPTGVVNVEVAKNGEPRFTIQENGAWDAITRGEATRHAASTADAVCFGSLAQRSKQSREAIQSLVSAAPPGALRIFDINLRQHYYSREVIEKSLAIANVLKVNETELPRLAEMFGLGRDERAQIQQLTERFKLRVVAHTRGGKGSLLYAGGRWSEHGGVPTQVIDTVGAGDAFTAAMTVGLLRGWDLEEVNARANEVAAFVCSRPGGTPELPPSLRAVYA